MSESELKKSPYRAPTLPPNELRDPELRGGFLIANLGPELRGRLTTPQSIEEVESP